ncbi:MAG: hypothetical protein AAF612_08115, partial [Planctomycetota bacterium]
GQPVVLTPIDPVDPAGGPLGVTGPSGQRIAGGVTYAGSGRATIAEIARTPAPGFYRLHQDDRLLTVQAVGMHPQESSVERIAPDEIVAAFSQAGAAGSVRSVVTGGSVLELDGEPLWGWLVAAAMGLLAMELGLLTWWRR